MREREGEGEAQIERRVGGTGRETGERHTDRNRGGGNEGGEKDREGKKKDIETR